MKKMLLLGSAAISALICTEWIVAKIIGYPTYGVEMKMLGIRGLDQPVNIFKPYSKYWTVEGGNKVYRRNNVGLPGINVKISNSSKYVFVLGSSFIEAYQLPPEKIATSILQKKLQIKNPDDQVLNLGISGHDPYDLFWRASYFEKRYFPSRVILVIDSTYENWFKRQRQPLDFNQNSKVPERLYSSKMKYISFIVNNSAFLNLVSGLIKNRNQEAAEIQQIKTRVAKSNKKANSDLIACISNFKEKYKDRFSLISIISENSLNSQIHDFCSANGIRFISRNVFLAKYLIKGKGHLNYAGNELVGDILYESFIKNE